MSAQKDIVTGYYRWTDIWFEWYVFCRRHDHCSQTTGARFCQILTMRRLSRPFSVLDLLYDVPYLALIVLSAHDAITHEDHPLRIEGVNGARMFMGRASFFRDSPLTL